MNSTITNIIRELRSQHDNMTQQDLADRAGVTRQTIAAIEKGHYSPSLEVAFRISRAFDKRLDEVFQFND